MLYTIDSIAEACDRQSVWMIHGEGRTTARAETEVTLMNVPSMVWGRVKR